MHCAGESYGGPLRFSRGDSTENLLGVSKGMNCISAVFLYTFEVSAVLFFLFLSLPLNNKGGFMVGVGTPGSWKIGGLSRGAFWELLLLVIGGCLHITYLRRC